MNKIKENHSLWSAIKLDENRVELNFDKSSTPDFLVQKCLEAISRFNDENSKIKIVGTKTQYKNKEFKITVEKI